ncbi:hypothetical protein D9M72_280490 [compost metagenome]
MHADHVLRTLGERGNLVDVQRGGVRSQDRALLHHLIQLLEDDFLDAHFLEHGLDDHVGVLDVVIGQRGAQQAHALLDLLLRELALLGAVLVVLADRGHATVQRFLLGFQHGDRDARVQEVHADAATHGAGADHGDLLDLASRRAFGHVGDLAGGTLAKEGVAQRARFRRGHQEQEALALFLETLLERLERAGHRFQALQRRREVLGHRGHGVAGKAQVAFGVLVAHLQVAHLGVRAGGGADVLRELDRRGQHVTVDDLVEQLGAGELLGQHRGARHDHVGGGLQADHARQALRAAGAGQQAQLHFRQRDLGALGRHAVVAAQRQFQAATHGDRVHGGHHRLGRAFQHADHRVQRRLLHGLGRIEFTDVGAARESLASAGDDDGLDGGIVQRTGHAFDDAKTGAVTQAVDRGIVERDDGYAVLNLILRCHAGSFYRSLSRDSNSRIIVLLLGAGAVGTGLTRRGYRLPQAFRGLGETSIHKIARSFNFNLEASHAE